MYRNRLHQPPYDYIYQKGLPMRVVEKKQARGSLKLIRQTVNNHSSLLNERIKIALQLSDDTTIHWKSPRTNDEYAEYGDNAFLKLLEIQLMRYPLKEFWPNRGPQWDALAITKRNDVTGSLLIEAKANIHEIVSPGTSASPESRKLIARSIEKVKQYLGVDPSIPWTGKLYQYANRIAHLYLLRELNGEDAHLIFVYFIGDTDVDGPSSVAEWQAALKVVKGVLGLKERHRLSKYIAEVYINVSEIK